MHCVTYVMKLVSVIVVDVTRCFPHVVTFISAIFDSAVM